MFRKAIAALAALKYYIATTIASSVLVAGYIVASVVMFCGGCVNCYTRFPTTEARIEGVYQCSREAAALSLICAFPQMMVDSPGKSGFMWENVFTIPIGFIGLCGTACEAAIDTALLPIDWPLAHYRKERRK